MNRGSHLLAPITESVNHLNASSNQLKKGKRLGLEQIAKVYMNR